MKKSVLFLLLVITVLCSGCFNSKGEGDSSDGKLSFNNASILDKYETKNLDENVTYKELYYRNNSVDEMRVAIIGYNNRDEAISVKGFVKGYKNNQKTNQKSQHASEYISGKSAYILSFALSEADSYKIESLWYYKSVISKPNPTG